jgi:branched-chain amino acid transport system permease protein
MGDVVLQGLLVGGAYVLIALGFAIVFRSSLVLNLAYGQQILILGYFLQWFLVSEGMPLWASVIVCLIVGGALGWVLERAFIRPLLEKPFLSILMMTLMLGFLLKGITVLWRGGKSYSMPFTPSGMWHLGGLQVLPAAAIAFMVAITAFLLILFVFRYTKIGLAMRAVTDDHSVAQSLGIRVRRIFSLSWVISGVFASLCAVIVGMVWTITPDMGDIALGKALPVLLLGGMDSISGAVVGGLVIGVAESLGGYWGGQVQTIIPWLVMLAILLVRPWGILGTRRIERI